MCAIQVQIRLILSLVGLGMLSCSPSRPDLASAADAKDFNGEWRGPWSWSSANSSKLEINGSRVRVAGLPILKDIASRNVMAFSGEGTATFERDYGPQRAPCVLLSFEGAPAYIAVFVAKDKKHLVYDVSTAQSMFIVFSSAH